MLPLGFYEDEVAHRFGWRKRGGEEVPQSDFSFKLTAKVVANGGSTGYLAEVTPETVGDGGGNSQSR